MKQENELLTLRAAAIMLGVNIVTLRKWDREGKLKAVRIGSRADRRYKKSDLAQFLDSSQNASKKEKIHWQEYIRNGTTYHIIKPVMDASDELIAFHIRTDESEGLGTQDTIEKARTKKIPVKIFSYNLKSR